jgi:tRNA modification GTPase
MISRDTIAAIATAPGRAGIGVVRISGTGLAAFAQSLTGRVLPPRHATLAPFRDTDGVAIDQGIALYFPAPASYTGEDVLELQGHGGPVVLRRLLQRCIELGARVAEPGEFTQRAFINGKLDLVQAEAVIDLIDASTAQAARGAMRSLHGDFSLRIQELSSSVIELRALVEATLDFPEEEIDILERGQARERLDRVRAGLEAVLEAARLGSLLREGLHIVLAGEPNVGKSSLLNRLAGEELAIVTEIPGTTRDPVRQVIDIGGIPAHVVDTAGLRDSADPVERIGVERAWGAIGGADVVVLVQDASSRADGGGQAIVERLPQHLPRIRVMNKIDLVRREPAIEQAPGETVVWLSAKTGAGLDLLRRALLAGAGWHGQEEAVFLARERHLEALAAAKSHLAIAGEQREVELFAEELRLAQQALSSITGQFTADDLLGEIFQRFCIGK